MVIVRNGLGESASGWQDLRVGGMEEDNEAESTNQPDAARILWQGGEPCGEPLPLGQPRYCGLCACHSLPEPGTGSQRSRRQGTAHPDTPGPDASLHTKGLADRDRKRV